ncbi:MAG TPA: RidA family protein [Candidatus Binatia bacterium]|nr:RidA family protein [Candidatus Binatia bacterium]
MPTRETIIPKGMENIYERFHYSPGVKIGNLLYIAGQVGRDENLRVIEGKEAQFAQAFENVQKVLSAAGATFDDVVEMVTYHTDMSDIQLFIKVKDRYFTNQYPTWTAIGTPALAMPGLLVEIKCTAVLPG